MAFIFVDSTAVGLNDGSTWADAYTSFSSSISALDGDTVAVSTNHSESLPSTTLYAFGSNISIINCIPSGVADIIELEYNPTIQLFSAGVQDVDFNCDDGCSIYGMNIAAGRVLGFGDFRTERCVLQCGFNGSSSPNFSAQGSSQSWESYYDRRINLSATSTEPVVFSSNRSFIQLFCGTIESARTVESSAHTAVRTSDTSSLLVDGVDCSNFEMSTFYESSNNNGALIARNCKLNNNTVNMESSISASKQGQKVSIDAVDQSSSQKSYTNEYRGIRQSDTAIYIDEPTSLLNQSHKIDVNSIPKGITEPLRLELAHGVADFSSAKTFRVEFVQDGIATTLTDAQIWMEIRYPLANNGYAYDTDRAINSQLAATQPVSLASWVGLSLSLIHI